jgi:hypothetical protein
MKMIRNTTILVGMLAAVPAMGFAQTPATKAPATAPATTAAKQSTTKSTPATKAAPAAKPAPAAKAEATKATKGVVKSVDATSLVITGAKNAEMTFVLNAATTKTGTPVVGANVQVRYKTEAKQNIATAVTVAAAKK